MEFGLLLRVIFASAVLCSVHCFPAKGSDGQQPQSPQIGMTPEFDPDFNAWLQEQLAAAQAEAQVVASEPMSTQMPPGSGPEDMGYDPIIFEPLPLEFGEGDQKSSMEPADTDTTTMLLEEPSAVYYPPEPVYRAGTVIRRLSTSEQGREASSFFDSGPLHRAPVPLAAASVEPEAHSNVGLPGMEHDDEFFQMFITGQLPPGTVTHFSSTYESGRNAWTDIGFERFPSAPSASMNSPVGQSKGAPVSKAGSKGSQDPPAKKFW
ncbi:uncharacterized protein LOC134460024 isoform X1 [Engraulis encrasicolus]|uniref:uncharacterized protein LOC134460024 isoform X1 n=2 Tax=Engraulis encrasicolus TaxID=184585 RepID=UPI002FD22D40